MAEKEFEGSHTPLSPRGGISGPGTRKEAGFIAVKFCYQFDIKALTKGMRYICTITTHVHYCDAMVALPWEILELNPWEILEFGS